MNHYYQRKRKLAQQNGVRDKLKNGIFYQLKNGCNWGEEPKDLPPYSTVFWHYKQWRGEGVIDEIMDTLHQQIRKKVKKNPSGQH